jgi:glycosyltransferase involved in cell wall biosynthesis
MNPMLSILIPSLPERGHGASLLITEIGYQIARAHQAGLPLAEVLMLVDNRRRPTGAKRNALIAIARGAYVGQVDDDDHVSTNYVEKILQTISRAPEADVIVFDIDVTGYAARGGHDKMARFDLAFGSDSDDGPFYKRLPNHLMIWRRSIARAVPFPEISRGEDHAWAKAACKLARIQMRIDGPPLYHYDFGPQSISALPLPESQEEA